MTVNDVRAGELQRAGYQRALKVFISKSQGQPPVYMPSCWVKITGQRVDIICEQPFDLVQTKVAAITVAFENVIIGWEEPTS